MHILHFLCRNLRHQLYNCKDWQWFQEKKKGSFNQETMRLCQQSKGIKEKRNPTSDSRSSGVNLWSLCHLDLLSAFNLDFWNPLELPASARVMKLEVGQCPQAVFVIPLVHVHLTDQRDCVFTSLKKKKDKIRVGKMLYGASCRK